MLLSFADKVLTRDQMKAISGGSGSQGTRCYCPGAGCGTCTYNGCYPWNCGNRDGCFPC